MDIVTVKRVRRALLTITTATHLGHRLSPVAAALVVRAQVATLGGAPITDDGIRALLTIERDCQPTISLALATGDAA